MKSKSLVIVIAALVVLVGCGPSSAKENPASTPTKPEATSTSAPPSPTPEPTACKDIDGNCMELYFDGERCTSKGQTEYKQGKFTLIYFNQSEIAANVGLFRLKQNKTYQDWIDYIGEEPSPKHGPMWAAEQGAWRTESDPVLPGEVYVWDGLLVFGTHAMVCTRAEPHGAWNGSWFSVIE